MYPELGEGDLSFEALLRHAAGRRDPKIASAIEASPELKELAAKLSRMVQLSRRNEDDGRSSPERQYFRRLAPDDGRAPVSASPSLQLAFDSRAGNAAALRSIATRDVRFMRYEGEYSVELQIRADSGGTEVRGQVSPHGAATWGIIIPGGSLEREFSIAQDGTFVVRGLHRECVEIDFGSARIAELTL